MDSLLYTALTMVTSVGSAALAYFILEARQRVAVAEERANSAVALTEQMRQVLELQGGRERPAPQPYAELLESRQLLEAHPGLQPMAFPVFRTPAILPSGCSESDAETPRRIESGESSGRPHHTFRMRDSHAETGRSRLKNRHHRWHPRIR